MFSDNNVDMILPLADEYQIMKVVENCEKFLLTQVPSVGNLALADRFDLNK